MKADVCRAGPVDVSRSRKSRPALQSHGFGAKTLKKRKREKSCVFWWIVSFLLWRYFSVEIDGDYELRCIKKTKQNKTKTKKNRKNPKKTNKWAQRRSEFLMHRNEWIKVVQVLSMIWCFYFINTEIFFLVTNTFQILELYEYGNASFVQSETRTIVSRSVNLCIYEIVFSVAVSIAPVYRVLFRLE